MNRFIVGTGRCGSTLLSTMIAANPEVASMFEYFNGLDMQRRFQAEPMTGAEYRDLICAPQAFLNMVLERGYPVPEVIYPLDDPNSRFGRGGDLPWILGTTVPRLAADPDAFYDKTRAFLAAEEPRPPVEHALHLFDWWTAEVGRSVWVERSGAAIDYLGALARHFPDGRFLHIHRQGEEAALSLREHHAFRLAIMLMHALEPDAGAPSDAKAGSEAHDRITQLLESRPPAELFGAWWNDQLAHGLAARSEIPAEHYHEVRFEDLVENPTERLAEIAVFLELPDPRGDWISEAAGLVRGTPPARLSELPAAEQQRLRDACRPGNEALGRA